MYDYQINNEKMEDACTERDTDQRHTDVQNSVFWRGYH